jgi:DNA-3-methyladenine glycosylase I
MMVKDTMDAKLKIDSTGRNARAFLAIQKEFGSFDAYVWGFVGGHPRVNRRRTLTQVPARTTESDALSRDLLRRGFKFVGSTICYAFMQAVGLVNDHTTDWFRFLRCQTNTDSASAHRRPYLRCRAANAFDRGKTQVSANPGGR